MATFHTVTELDSIDKVYRGSWTTESSKADHTIYFPMHVQFIIVQLDSGGTSPNWLIKFDDETNETTLITGTTGVFTSPTDATGITITDRSGGHCSVLISSNSMENSGTNQWIAFCNGYGKATLA